MNEDMQSNPDYQLVMKFLQSIRPGDMDAQSAEQLMAIGQRIQNGGTLTEREREMLASVVGAMPNYNPANNFGSMSEGEARLAMDQGSMGGMSEGEMRMMQNQQFNQDAQNFQGRAFRNNEDVYSGSSGVSSSLAPDTSMRPRPRPENLGQMRPRPRPASME
jgi:hypothetical protein